MEKPAVKPIREVISLVYDYRNLENAIDRFKGTPALEKEAIGLIHTLLSRVRGKFSAPQLLSLLKMDEWGKYEEYKICIDMALAIAVELFLSPSTLEPLLIQLDRQVELKGDFKPLGSSAILFQRFLCIASICKAAQLECVTYLSRRRVFSYILVSVVFDNAKKFGGMVEKNSGKTVMDVLSSFVPWAQKSLTKDVGIEDSDLLYLVGLSFLVKKDSGNAEKFFKVYTKRAKHRLSKTVVNNLTNFASIEEENKEDDLFSSKLDELYINPLPDVDVQNLTGSSTAVEDISWSSLEKAEEFLRVQQGIKIKNEDSINMENASKYIDQLTQWAEKLTTDSDAEISQSLVKSIVQIHASPDVNWNLSILLTQDYEACIRFFDILVYHFFADKSNKNDCLHSRVIFALVDFLRFMAPKYPAFYGPLVCIVCSPFSCQDSDEVFVEMLSDFALISIPALDVLMDSNAFAAMLDCLRGPPTLPELSHVFVRTSKRKSGFYVLAQWSGMEMHEFDVSKTGIALPEDVFQHLWHPHILSQIARYGINEKQRRLARDALSEARASPASIPVETLYFLLDCFCHDEE